MKEFVELLRKASDKIKSTDSIIQLVSHYDCDGITSAAIMAATLLRLNKNFQITIVKRIKKEMIEEVSKREPKLVIFTDIGSSYIDDIKNLACDIIICDHHEIEGQLSENIIQINPEPYDIHLTGAGITYILAREILQDNSLSPLAIIGTVGDMASVNSRIFENSQIEVERGLNLFGRFTRPIYKAVELSGIPDIGDASKAIQFLSEVGIELQKDGEWRTLNDLTEEEKRRLADAIVKEKLKYGVFRKEEIFGDVLTLKNFPDELRDAKEFATLLNACSRMGDSATGIALCLGSKKALEDARGLMRGYKRYIANSLEWIRNNPEYIKQTDSATYIVAKDNIHENLIGTVVSMLSDSSEKPMIGFANAEDGVKVSARSKTVNIHKVVREAAQICGGLGGGHAEAAGALIPAGSEEKFIETCENLLKEKFIKA